MRFRIARIPPLPGQYTNAVPRNLGNGYDPPDDRDSAVARRD